MQTSRVLQGKPQPVVDVLHSYLITTATATRCATCWEHVLATRSTLFTAGNVVGLRCARKLTVHLNYSTTTADMHVATLRGNVNRDW